jgi:hypothetical protein
MNAYQSGKGTHLLRVLLLWAETPEIDYVDYSDYANGI